MFAPQDPIPRVIKLQLGEEAADDEISFLLMLRHPNLCAIYEAFTLEVEGKPIRAIVMDRFLLLGTGKP